MTTSGGGPTWVDRASLYTAVAAGTVGLGVILALLADLQEALGIPTSGLGLVAGASFAASFVGYVWLSRYADRGHARAMLLLGALGGAAGLVLAAFATGMWSLVAARALLGLAEGAFIPAARRMVLDWTPDRPGEVLGRVLAASVAGFSLGPMLGALLAARFGLRVPFLVPAAVLLLTIPVVLRLRVPVPAVIERAGRSAVLLRNPLVVAGIAVGTIEFASIGAFDAVWARLLTDLGASTEFIGISFTLIALPLVLLAPVFGRTIDRRTPIPIAWAGLALAMPAMVAYGVADHPWLIAAVATVHGVGSAALAPASAALVASGSPPDMVARGQGFLEAFGFLAAAVVAFPTGWAYQELGRGVWFPLLAAVGVTLMGFATAQARRSARAAAGWAPG